MTDLSNVSTEQMEEEIKKRKLSPKQKDHNENMRRFLLNEMDALESIEKEINSLRKGVKSAIHFDNFLLNE